MRFSTACDLVEEKVFVLSDAALNIILYDTDTGYKLWILVHDLNLIRAAGGKYDFQNFE
jgi:hypothetical protein